MENCILTWDKLYKRGFRSPSTCILCKRSKENEQHHFVEYNLFQEVWMVIMESLNLFHSWDCPMLGENTMLWRSQFPTHKYLPLFMQWGIWKAQNALIFENLSQSPTVIGLKCLSFFLQFFKPFTRKIPHFYKALF